MRCAPKAELDGSPRAAWILCQLSCTINETRNAWSVGSGHITIAYDLPPKSNDESWSFM